MATTWNGFYYVYMVAGLLACGQLAWWNTGMRKIGMEDNWYAENWHGGQLALTFLIVSYLMKKMKNVYFQTLRSFYIIFS